MLDDDSERIDVLTKGEAEEDPTYKAFVRNGIDVFTYSNCGWINAETLTVVHAPTFTMIWEGWNEDMIRTAIENYPIPAVIEHDEKEA